MNKLFSYFWSSPSPAAVERVARVHVAPPKERVHVEYPSEESQDEHHVQIGFVKETRRIILAHRPSFHDNE